MGKLSYTDVKNVIEYNSESNDKGYKFPLFPRLNNVIGNIQQGQTHVISGLPSAGTTSFVDQNYIMSVLLQWYNTDPDERSPLKIFYYSMKDTELKKIQLLLCNYIKLIDNLKTDIATLNSQAGQLYELKGDSALQKSIEDASVFFNEIIDDEVLVIKAGQFKPTDIYNDVINFVNTVGSKNSQKEFEYDEDNDKLLTLVVVDSVEHLLPDDNGFGIISGSELAEKFQRQIRELKTLYGISTVLVVPSNPGYIRSPKDTEPHYKHLGTYGSIADKGICIYNSIAEKHTKFYNGDADLYTSPRGSVLMRTWHVVRNSDGIESVFDRMLFLPGTSYMVEHEYKNKVDDFDDVLQVLIEETSFSD